MIFTKVFIDNLYSFSNTEVDFTFPRKIKNSTIKGESLQCAPKFKYKKACILSGANASGKTAFGRVLCGIQNFIHRQEITSYLRDGVCDKSKMAELQIEFASINSDTRGWELHCLKAIFSNTGKSAKKHNIKYASTPIRSSDTNSSARRRLNDIFNEISPPKALSKPFSIDFDDPNTEIKKFDELRLKLDKLHVGGWHYEYADNRNDSFSGHYKYPLKEEELVSFLSTFDPSIEKVKIMTSGDNVSEGIKIFFKNQDSVSVLFGKDTNAKKLDRLSRGTQEAVIMVDIFASMKKSIGSNIYYIDEKMAYSHSEMEQAIINLLVESLPLDSQIFYTTHNYDIIDLNFPIHSYYIFKKNGSFSKIIDVGKKFKKNDRGLINYLKNDAFRTLPETSGIDGLL